ncbi:MULTISPECIES: hypothetical protein [Clostridium]|uniref:Uncharacterized protein n=2 Tax=Clostridium TaxID=1485 RepID=A0A151ARK6_9CLOT|nr:MULTISPECIES: hypothetical protein [Clostridium]KYH30278.1 hypothetical protein CLCOL_02240 [Clostridium colicanis DSM 13634]MBE6044495.1 hypothetical protein [Clostridium thermopalmarium]PRR69392.1 hypothetical protein CPAL_24780 [Clostridium thermopalmarium DSM 5974]PVZ26342.1 hypothetical protein LX19_00838 [Clostridium thermopalmarium DSM 5974]
MSILNLIIVSMIAEAVWETLKMVWQKGKIHFDKIGALFIGIIIASATQMDMLSMLGMPSYIPYIGILLTGVLISRGANFMHDLLSAVNNIQQNTKKMDYDNIKSSKNS